ncbi:RagB/SusD family nutrient uptake outer membrane protein [uncultured Parabacteroides sp.]|uniref:RagB/SusD family nutrient uptake outer membrane protein n=1 Tax=uncultured Parabacteroides sp. TaxID=512312 RepID=UPI0028042D4D|nr:RagB/SusD family nutrient uptake outer membrane protein [uncultured Parabacteroides sp.]MBD9167855.1 RagB/SusD family nutrient uptake outer membrane protein [Parabacteroides johnsonii]
MKNIKNILFALAFGSAISFSSCSDFMDISPSNEYEEEEVFNSAGLVQAYVNRVYSYIQHGAKEHTTTGLTDDGYFTHNYGQIAVNEANVSQSDLQWYDRDECPFKWGNRYKGIRYANDIINNIDKVPQDDNYDLNQIKGEAHFLRAYLYTELVRGFGGVPIVTTVVKDYNDTEAMKQPRNTMKECLEFIVKDCEIAEQNLPETVSTDDLGRATKFAATALKARILLHVASPLYADRTVNTLSFNQYDGDRAALYRAAKEAADQVINSGIYELLDCRGGTNIERSEKWRQIILTNNNEQIWTHQFGLLDMSGIDLNNLVLQHGPNGYHNWSGITPTQDLVMAFEFEDGTMSTGMTKPGDHQIGNPYNGREPRFYATVGTDGNEWGRPRPADAKGLDPTPMGRLQCGYYEVTDGDAQIELSLPDGSKVNFTGMNGIDTRKGPIEDWNGSWTGYYERKLVDTNVDGQYYKQKVPWTYIRLAEMYLIAAEACVELNDLEGAAQYLDALRERIGIKTTKEALTAQGKAFNQTDMRDFVRHERRVELAYEESRYYDVRRWMIAPETNNKELTGVLVFARLKPGKTAKKPYIHNEETWDYHYYIQSLKFRENRRWDNKMYFAPISRDEINRNELLVQNPGME